MIKITSDEIFGPQTLLRERERERERERQRQRERQREREREREREVLWERRVLPKNTTHSPNQVLDPDLLTQNSVHWQVEHCVFSLGVATPSPKVAQGLPRLHFTFVEGRVLLLVGYCIFHKWPTGMFYTHLIPFVMLYLPCHLEEQHHPTCHLHISLLVWKVYTSYIQVYLKK